MRAGGHSFAITSEAVLSHGAELSDTGGSNNPSGGGRGHAVGLYVRFVMTRNHRAPIRRRAAVCGSAPAGAHSWIKIDPLLSMPFDPYPVARTRLANATDRIPIGGWLCRSILVHELLFETCGEKNR